MDKMKKTDHTKCLQECEAIGTVIHCWWEWKIVWPLWREFCQFFFFFKLKIYLPYDSAIPSLFIYTPPKKKKKREIAYIHTKIRTPMFIIALFEIIKNGKQSRRIPENEQINNFWHICTIEWYSSIKKRNNLCRQKHDWISK